MARRLLFFALSAVLAGAAGARELTSAYVITAAANKTGMAGTDWHTDLTLYNPHATTLPLVLQFLPTATDNSGRVLTVTLDVYPWETLNLWDVLGPDGFNVRGKTGALLVYADDEKISCSGVSCEFAAFARTYTLNPTSTGGEYGQAVPGFPADLGLDWSVIGYLPQLSDDVDFRTNLGMASWTSAHVRVRFELQDAGGDVIDVRDHWVPPFGHVQWRMERGVTGGTVAVYVVGGPDDAMVYPYASVVDWSTGDAVNVEAHLTTVGLGAQAASIRGTLPRPAREHVPSFSLDRLRQRRE